MGSVAGRDHTLSTRVALPTVAASTRTATGRRRRRVRRGWRDAGRLRRCTAASGRNEVRCNPTTGRLVTGVGCAGGTQAGGGMADERGITPPRLGTPTGGPSHPRPDRHRPPPPTRPTWLPRRRPSAVSSIAAVAAELRRHPRQQHHRAIAHASFAADALPAASATVSPPPIAAATVVRRHRPHCRGGWGP